MPNPDEYDQTSYRQFVIRHLPGKNIGFYASLDIPNRISITLCADTMKQMRKEIDTVMERAKTLHIGIYCPKKTEKVLVFSPQKGGFITEVMVMMPSSIKGDEFYDLTNITITSKPHKSKSKGGRQQAKQEMRQILVSIELKQVREVKEKSRG